MKYGACGAPPIVLPKLAPEMQPTSLARQTFGVGGVPVPSYGKMAKWCVPGVERELPLADGEVGRVRHLHPDAALLLLARLQRRTV